MSALYRLLTSAGSALVVPSLYLRSAGDDVARRRLRERLGRLSFGTSARRRLWLQAVSVGEVRLAETLLRELRLAGPRQSIFLSSTTATGIEAAERLTLPGGDGLADEAFAFPLDLRGAVGRTLDAVQPAAYGSIETEIWPGLLSECGRRRLPTFMASGSISERSARRYTWIAGAVREGLGALSAACMQTQADAERIIALGAPEKAVVVTGNMKFDAPGADVAEKSSALARTLALTGAEPVFVAGSTAPGEETIVLDAFRIAALAVPGLVLIVAPRHRERFDEAAAGLKRAGARVLRRTAAQGAPRAAGDVILLDTLGELEAAYGFATVAFVGGSLVPRGGQNPLEPARAGVPVFFGPGMDNFRDVAAVLKLCGGAFEVRDAAGLAEGVVRMARDPAARAHAARAARSFVETHAGAAHRTVAALRRLIPDVFAKGDTVPEVKE